VTYDRSTNMSRSVCILLILAVAAFSADASKYPLPACDVMFKQLGTFSSIALKSLVASV